MVEIHFGRFIPTLALSSRFAAPPGFVWYDAEDIQKWASTIASGTAGEEANDGNCQPRLDELTRQRGEVGRRIRRE
jgi:hypothetical protein